jgi:hypothetical protein
MNRLLPFCSSKFAHPVLAAKADTDIRQDGMKLIHSSLIAIIVAAGFVAVPNGHAQAQSGYHLNWLLPGFPPPPRRHYYYSDDYDYYDDDEYYDDEVYYYPYYEEDGYYDEPPPRYKPRRKSKSTTVYSEPEDVESAPAPSKKKPTTKSKTATKTAPAVPAAPKTTTNVSCDKAKSIISGYGFGDVQTRSCEGKTYSFAAKRGGKSFSVKVSSLNGELTEVKRE